MKKYVIMGLALMIGSFTFAQKKELKEAEKAIKSNNYATAKTALESAGAMIGSMDDKTKAKYYYLKGQAYYANGSGSDADVTEALTSFDMMKEIEAKSGKKTYTDQANAMQATMSNDFLTKAQSSLSAKNFGQASKHLERAYRTGSDTLFLYNAALTALSAKELDRALELYKEVADLKFTGERVEYWATNVETGEAESFPEQIMRDLAVRAGSHEKSENRKTESVVGEVAKNIALIYVDKGENELAFKAIEEAKAINGVDAKLLLAEAQIHRETGNTEKYKETLVAATELEPNNASLWINLGVLKSDEKDHDGAKEYYKKAVEIDPSMSVGYKNIAVTIFDQVDEVVTEMNSLGNSKADDERYEELRILQENLYREAVPFLEQSLELEPAIDVAKSLASIYSVLGETDKYDAIQAKIAEMEGGN